MNTKYFWIIIILASLALSILVQTGQSSFNTWHILQRATGIIIFPGLATVIVFGVSKIFKKHLTGSELRNIFAILWVLGLLFLLVPFFSG